MESHPKELQMDTRCFPSKIDWWIGLLLCVPPISTVVSLIALYRSDDPEAWMGWIFVAVVVALYGGLIFPMRYEVGEDALVIRFGQVRSRVKYTDIRRVKPTHNPLSSPALSLSRLHIDCGSSLGPNISPADRQGFLRALAQKTPHLRLEGDSLVPLSTEGPAVPPVP